jgi:sugar/nucleoside kinase (ribokinase family)
VIWSRINIDEVTGTRGGLPEPRLGGAGTYAALGARMAVGRAPYVRVLSRVGADFFPRYGGWFSAWGIDVFPGAVVGEKTPRSRLVYGPDAERTEFPPLGEEHFALFDVGGGELVEQGPGCKGLYVFRGADRGLCEALGDVRGSAGTVLWEIDRGSCHPTRWRDVARVLACVDLFSISEAEAFALCSSDETAACLELLRASFNGVLLYRMGRRGSYVACGQRLLRARGAQAVRVVDPTGAGNAYSGAFLGSWCERPKDLEVAARVATAVGGLVVGQEGPLEDVEAALREASAGLASSTELRELTERDVRKEQVDAH